MWIAYRSWFVGVEPTRFKTSHQLVTSHISQNIITYNHFHAISLQINQAFPLGVATLSSRGFWGLFGELELFPSRQMNWVSRVSF